MFPTVVNIRVGELREQVGRQIERRVQVLFRCRAAEQEVQVAQGLRPADELVVYGVIERFELFGEIRFVGRQPHVGIFSGLLRVGQQGSPVELEGQYRVLCGILFRSVVRLEEAEQFGMLPGLYHAVGGDAAEQTAVFVRGLRVFRSPGYFGRDASAGFPVVTVDAA